MTPDSMRRQIDHPDLWDAETARQAAASSYLNAAREHIDAGHDHFATVEILNRAYWAELDDPEPDR